MLDICVDMDVDTDVSMMQHTGEVRIVHQRRARQATINDCFAPTRSSLSKRCFLALLPTNGCVYARTNEQASEPHSARLSPFFFLDYFVAFCIRLCVIGEAGVL